MVAGYAIGGGHVLHIVCDLTIAADNAVFGQTGPKVGSFDGGYGAGYLARMVGHKKAREIWYLCRQYSAGEALDMGLVNTVVPLEQLEAETVQWAQEILANSPMALRFLKAAFNADTDGLAGIQQLAGDATLLYYTTDEAKEGRDAFKEKRSPDFGQFLVSLDQIKSGADCLAPLTKVLRRKRLAHKVSRNQMIKPETKQLRDLMSHQVSFFHERRMYDGDDAKLVKATCIFNTRSYCN